MWCPMAGLLEFCCAKSPTYARGGWGISLIGSMTSLLVSSYIHGAGELEPAYAHAGAKSLGTISNYHYNYC